MIPSEGFDAASSTTSFRSCINCCTAVRIASRRAVNRYGLSNGGASGVLSRPKSMPRPVPVSVFVPLLPAVRLPPVSRTRSLFLSTPFPWAKTTMQKHSDSIKAVIKRDMMITLSRAGKISRGNCLENRLTAPQIQGIAFTDTYRHCRLPIADCRLPILDCRLES